MQVNIESTTDSAEAVSAAIAGKKVEANTTEDVENKSAPEIENDTDESESTESEAEENDDLEDSDEESGEKDKPKKKSGFKRRIDKLNSKLTAKEQEIEYWRKEALKNSKQGPEAKETKTVDKKLEGKPHPDSFDSQQEYVEALTEWKLEQKLSEQKAKDKEVETKTAAQKQFDEHTKRVQEFAKKQEDFLEAIEDIDDIRLSMTVEDVIVGSENGPELMYELAKNRKELERICALPPIAAARELGKIEARLQKSSSDEPKKITKTPAPLKPISSKSSAAGKSLEDADYEDFKRMRHEQLKKNRS